MSSSEQSKGLIRPDHSQKIHFFGKAAEFLKTTARKHEVWKRVPKNIRSTIERYFSVHEYLNARAQRNELRKENIETVIVPVVQLILLRNGLQGLEIFWGKRAAGGLRNRWSIPGGKREKGEDFETAALRELEEEVGIEIEKDELLPLGRYISSTVEERSGKKINREFRIQRYAILAQNLEPKNTAPTEHSEMRWMSLEEALKLHQGVEDGERKEDTFTPRALGVIEEFGDYSSAEEAVENLKEE